MTLQWVDWLLLGVLGGGFGFITAATVHNWIALYWKFLVG